jgi:membrane protein YqaA with SNARE-associated domain
MSEQSEAPKRGGMLRGLYAWTMARAGHPHAVRYLALISFAESSFFPLPPDLLLIPMMLAQRQRAFYLALVCTIASVLGGILGYFIGSLLFQSVGQWLIGAYGLNGSFTEFHDWYEKYGVWVILIKGLTPIPYKLVTIASGFAAYNLPLFILLSAITRGARFFGEGVAIYYFGEPAARFIEDKLEWVLLGALVLIVGGIAASHYLF